MHTPSTYEDFWCPLSEVPTMRPIGSISGNEWIALLKIANGDWSIPAGDLACLLERKLIEITTGFIRLTDEGQVALGLPV
jgi:hypothetical protein